MNPFKRSSAHYGETPIAATPYQKAGQVWDERMGTARVQAANWRLMAFGCLTLAGLCSAALIWRSLQSTVTPYVVEIDSVGEARAVRPAIEDYRPTDAQIAHHLARFLENVRGLSLDRGAFLSDLRRGGSTLIAALAAGAIPSSIRQRVFA